MKTVNYDSKVGVYIFPKGFKELLQGKSIEEQLNYYRISQNGDFLYYVKNFINRTNDHKCYKVNEEIMVESLIIDDGVIVGVNLKTPKYGVLACFAEQGIIVDDDNKNETDSIKRRFLICVPDNFEN